MINNTNPGTTKSSDPTDQRRPNIITPGISPARFIDELFLADYIDSKFCERPRWDHQRCCQSWANFFEIRKFCGFCDFNEKQIRKAKFTFDSIRHSVYDFDTPNYFGPETCYDFVSFVLSLSNLILFLSYLLTRLLNPNQIFPLETLKSDLSLSHRSSFVLSKL